MFYRALFLSVIFLVFSQNNITFAKDLSKMSPEEIKKLSPDELFKGLDSISDEQVEKLLPSRNGKGSARIGLSEDELKAMGIDRTKSIADLNKELKQAQQEAKKRQAEVKAIKDKKNNNSQAQPDTSEPKSNKKFSSNPLMLSPKEHTNLEKALSSLINNVEYVGESLESISDESDMALEKEEEKNEKSYIYLASLLYFGPNSWVVWINDRKITSDENDPEKEFYIKHINRNSVDLVWTLGITKWKIITGKNEDQMPEKNDKNQIINSFTLRPNQTYVLADHNVVEGKVSITKAENSDNVDEEDDPLNIPGSANEFDFF